MNIEDQVIVEQYGIAMIKDVDDGGLVHLIVDKTGEDIYLNYRHVERMTKVKPEKKKVRGWFIFMFLMVGFLMGIYGK